MPRPPPPNALFTGTGKPISEANFEALLDRSVARVSRRQPGCRMIRRASSFQLLPLVASVSGLGPTNFIPLSSHNLENSLLSESKPYPGCIMSQSALRAISIIFLASRYVSVGKNAGQPERLICHAHVLSARIRIRIYCNRFHANSFQCSNDSYSDFSSVCNGYSPRMSQ